MSTIVRTPPEWVRRDVLYEWALKETAPWIADLGGTPMARAEYDHLLYAANDGTPDVFVLDYDGSTVAVRPKTNPHAQPGALEKIRLPGFVALFERAAARLSDRTPRSFAICVGDMVTSHDPAPILTIQKTAGASTILMPDPEFHDFGFYEDAFTDLPFEEKFDQVVFAGSSTGKMLSDEDVRTDNSDRLGLAQRFHGRDDIIVKIGAVVQCYTEAGTIELQRKPYCQQIPWAEQIKRRYILSIDGNGATCSRVVLTLRSQSVLLKYRSNERLFYFHGLRPMEHYVPIESGDDLEAKAAALRSGEIQAQGIIANANAFFGEHLKQDPVEEYVACLMDLLPSCVAEA